ncbi:hypothetical protein T11_12950 [Trichinella zimbabwensis]|uniref:Uncharacterized protein n=1 Tax=Trichinella zimbabwensis TaxID=268475 RepID=A0A0V1HQB3_9BILA|nr:hypothetical protein T11_12950 [Trichinella zimbabwensis]
MKNSVLKFIRITVGSQHSRYVRSVGTTNFLSPMLYNTTHLSESFKRYQEPSTDLHVKYLSLYNSQNHCQNSIRHYVFAQILRCSHAILDYVSMKAEVWTFPDMSGLVDQSGSSVWNHGTGAAVDQLPGRSASFPFTLIISSCYLASHGFEIREYLGPIPDDQICHTKQ